MVHFDATIQPTSMDRIVKVCNFWAQHEQSEFAVRVMHKYSCLCDADSFPCIHYGFATAKSFQHLSLLFRYYDHCDAARKAARLLEKALAETRNFDVNVLEQKLGDLHVK